MFKTAGSPLFEEYVGLADFKATVVPALTADDALVIIDMQGDFVERGPANLNGGRFGVSEGNLIAPTIEALIDAAVEAGASIVATRDYHPVDHRSFIAQGGPFPAHCIQGSEGSKFLPSIGAKLIEAAGKLGLEKVKVAFKGMHEDMDSFGAFPYYNGGEGRICKGCRAEKLTLGEVLGCAAAPWSGSIIVKCSNMDTTDGIDLDAPPDMLAMLDDGLDRGRTTIQDYLRNKKRIFICGLALDFCVMDSCLNAIEGGFEAVHMIFDAARAAHIPGIGTFGSGFLSNPNEARGAMGACH